MPMFSHAQSCGKFTIIFFGPLDPSARRARVHVMWGPNKGLNVTLFTDFTDFTEGSPIEIANEGIWALPK